MNQADPAQADPPVNVSIFGPLSVRSGVRLLGPTSFGGVKPKALFEILLLARGHLVSKDALADALWPEDPPQNVTGTLETYVSVLRRTMFEDRARARRVIVTAPGAYRLALDEISLDVDRFDDLLLRAERAGHRQRRVLWMEAVALATGDLLEDEPYAPWVQAERERYRGKVARSHLLVAEDSLLDGDFIVALRHGEAALLVHPFAEEAFRAVMLANHALGHTDTSRQVFVRCREVLGRELGLDPSTETVDLAGAIDAGTPAHELITSVPQAAAPLDCRDRRDPAGRMPFLGRAPEIARLRAHVESSRQGRFGLILVEGRPGFGRTALLDHLQSSLTGVVGRAAYSPRDQELPSLPFASALRDAFRSSSGADDAERYANAPWLSSAEHAVESLYQLVQKHSPLVLLLDDLHWADRDTLLALEWLRQRAPGLALAIIATIRSAEPDEGSPLARLSATDRIRLCALTPADSVGSPDFDQEIVRTTGGNPQLMADLWRWRQAGHGDWPPSLGEAVKRRVRGLGGQFPALLQAAAELPEPFDLFDLLTAFEAGEPSMESEVKRLCDLEFLETTPGGFRFVEPVVRDVLATLTPPAGAGRDPGRRALVVSGSTRTPFSGSND